jgi:hypothetical protein
LADLQARDATHSGIGQAHNTAKDLASKAGPTGEKINKEHIQPLGEQAAEELKSKTGVVTEEYLKPVADDLAENAEPKTKEFTEVG